MSAEALPFLTPEEYLARERAAETRSEYYAGQMYAMAGASLAHITIVGNLGAELRAALRGSGYRTYMSDLRVKVTAAGLYTYPDVIVGCGKPELEDRHRDTLLNPVVLIEVLSPSTETYDRGLKFELYQKLASLQEYVLVAQDRPRVEVLTRQEQGATWLYRVFEGLETSLLLASVCCSIPLSEIYYEVELPLDANGMPDRP